MGREKRNLPAAVAGGPKERHRRAMRSQYDPTAPVPAGLIAKPAIPKSKHHSYFEFVENKEKKKKLEFQITTAKTPPPGFEFVPIGDPQLTTECKELSREKDAMIFIVSNSKETKPNFLASQVHRIGHHIRRTIVEEARENLGHTLDRSLGRKVQAAEGHPEPIPESQEEYNAQVDAAIRDLFPRIPNTDRQMIIEHAFRRGATFKGEKPVGLSADITLARRVQLAVLAHIRHNHTRYDTLLRETTWNNARKVVEALCLDTLVKWRGDEETGRDQLDEILREVVVISDSEGEASEDESDDSSIEEIAPLPRAAMPVRIANIAPGQAAPDRLHTPTAPQNQPGPMPRAKSKGKVKKNKGKNKVANKETRGFKRYHAWQEAIRRFREEQDPESPPPIVRQPGNAPEPYHQLAARTTAPYTPTDTRDGFRFDAPEAAGPAPNENGYVGQVPASHSNRPPLNSQPQFPLPPRRSMVEKVVSPAHELSPVIPSPRRSRSLAAGPLQDMLVRSIEPASPNAMEPSFVRVVPPRTQGYRDRSPIRSNIAVPSRIISPLREVSLRDDLAYSSRRVRSDHYPPEIQPSGNYRDERTLQSPGLPHHQRPSQDSYSAPITPLYRPGPASQSLSHASLMASDRVFTFGPRPGERTNPILMEDRGGFFERVPRRPDTIRTYSGDVEVRRPTQDAWRMPEPHRIVSGEEGSRILRESRGHAGVEIIPISRGPPLPHEARSRPIFVESPIARPRTPEGVVYGRLANVNRPSLIEQRHASETRPVSGQPMYRTYSGTEPRSRVSYDEAGPQHYDDSAVPTLSQDPRRRYPLRIHNPADVIVLD